MVNDVAKLTRSIRRSVAEDRARTSFRALTLPQKQKLRAELDEQGRATYSDDRGNRYLVERRRS